MSRTPAAIGTVPSTVDGSTRRFLQAVKENIESLAEDAKTLLKQKVVAAAGDSSAFDPTTLQRDIAGLKRSLQSLVVLAGANGVEVADIKMHVGAPGPGWSICDGGALNRIDFGALYAKIGNTYGAGDGSTTFNKPDFADAVPYGNTPAARTGSNTIDLEHDHGAGSLVAADHEHGAGSLEAADHHHDGGTLEAEAHDVEITVPPVTYGIAAGTDDVGQAGTYTDNIPALSVSGNTGDSGALPVSGDTASAGADVSGDTATALSSSQDIRGQRTGVSFYIFTGVA